MAAKPSRVLSWVVGVRAITCAVVLTGGGISKRVFSDMFRSPRLSEMNEFLIISWALENVARKNYIGKRVFLITQEMGFGSAI